MVGKIAVIGLGRVGLPFACSLHQMGFPVIGIDNNLEWVERLSRGGEFPFLEPGYENLPEASDRWSVRSSFADVGDADVYVVTVGTPLDSNLTPNLGPIRQVVDGLAKEVAKGKLLIFRSTLGMGVTQAILKYLEHASGDLNGQLNVAYCPERLAEGKAYEELRTLPQIVSASNEQAYEGCVSIFSRLAPRIHRVSFREAELVKLLCNTSRYMNFAVANWVHEFILAQDIDPHTLVAIANDGYPRPIPDRAGFTAGTCLRKDYGLLVQDQVLGDHAISAWRVNERQPLSLLNAVKRQMDISGKTVAILGVGFKRDVDDIRDSLALKLADMFLPECRKLFYQDPLLGNKQIDLGLAPIKGMSMDDVESMADVILIGANHSQYEGLAARIRSWKPTRRRLVVDIWNVTGFGRTISVLEPEQ